VRPPVISAADARDAIERLIDNLVNIKDETGEFLLKLEDGRVIDTKGWAGWEWTHGIGLYGILKHWRQGGAPRALDIMLSWFRDRFAEGQTTKNVNTMAPFLTLAFLYECAESNGPPDGTPAAAVEEWKGYLHEWAEWAMRDMPRTEERGLQHIVYNSENREQLWDDTLMMCALPLAKIGLVLGRPAYVEEAKRQFLLHVKYLVDRGTGLWRHGWTFDGRHHFAGALWARGNAWVTIAIPEFVELLDLPPGEGVREFLIETLDSQAQALAQHQHESGLWHTLIPDPASYLEASASAGFAYGLLKGTRRGYLDARYRRAGLKAVKAVLDNISAEGELLNVSFGTPVFNTLDEYRNVPLTSMPYGQALAILALVEALNHI
jgi:unsaturated rhamnogalacturonyl hydrolase